MKGKPKIQETLSEHSEGNSPFFLDRKASRYWQREIHKDPVGGFRELFLEKGDVVVLFRGNQRVCAVNDPSILSNLMKSAGPLLQKTRKRRPVFGDGLVTSEGEEWRAQRDVGRLFFSKFKSSESYIQESWVESLAEIQSHQGKPFCLFHQLSRFNLNMISRVLFGLPMPREVSQAIIQSVDILIRKKPSGLRILSVASWRYAGALKQYREAVHKMISLGESSSKGTFLEFLRETGREKGVTAPLFDQVSTYLLAALDTSASAVSSACYLLSEAPAWVERIRRDEGRESVDLALKESMRLLPPVWMMSRYLTEDVVLEGVPFPGAMEWVWFPYLMHRSPKFWENPDLFRPERFLGSFPATAYMPFGMGERSCIGRALAHAAASAFLSGLYRNFHLRFQSSFRPQYLFTLRPNLPLSVEVEPL